MREAVRRKFEANPGIREVLLSTGDAELVEKTTGDYYWGCGTDGTGKNMLGKILMEVRGELRRGGG
jgi:N-glycosidase YbiA